MTSQRHTLELFTALRLLEPSWAGSLLLGVRLDDTGRALALASLAVGAAALFLEQEEECLRTAQRDGCCDFSVSTLDEALRILKNEIRKGRAITVALSGEPAAWLRQMAQRGVQPDYVASCSAVDEVAVSALRAQGARTLTGLGVYGTAASIDLKPFVATVIGDGWHIAEETASTALLRRSQDMALLASLNGDDPMMGLGRQWLAAAPTLFPRALHRAVWTRTSTE